MRTTFRSDRQTTKTALKRINGIELGTNTIIHPGSGYSCVAGRTTHQGFGEQYSSSATSIRRLTNERRRICEAIIELSLIAPLMLHIHLQYVYRAE